MSDHEIKPVPPAAVNGETYPAPVNAASFLATPNPLSVPLIAGLLRRGEMGIMAGESKSNKSWAALQAAVCVSNGLPFLGMDTDYARVLVVNTELQDSTLHYRLGEIRKAVADNTGSVVGLEDIELWNLRNTRIGKAFCEELARVCKEAGAGFVILDPLYPLLGDRDENSNGEMAALLGEVRGFCEGVEAAVLITHHYAKGNSAAKAAIDRASGAGAIARFADSMLAVSRHTKEGHFVLETDLRSFAPFPSTVLKWDFPLLYPVVGEDAKALRGGRPRAAIPAAILPLFEEGMTRSKWAQAAADAGVVGFSTAGKLIKAMIDGGDIEERDDGLHKKIGPSVSFRMGEK